MEFHHSYYLKQIMMDLIHHFETVNKKYHKIQIHFYLIYFLIQNINMFYYSM
jgi:hypothetical protein